MNPEGESGFVTPEIVVSHFHIRDGDVVADFGAGSGYYIPELSRRVGNGRVYACEIQKALVEKVGALARERGLTNVHPLWCDLEEPNGLRIQDSSVDVGILINTLFVVEDKNAAIKELSRTIRPGGRMIVIDWTDSFGGMGPAPEHVVTAAETTAMLESQHYVLEQEFPAGSHHYGLSFRKL